MRIPAFVFFVPFHSVPVQLAALELFNKFGMHAQLLDYYNTHPTLFPKVTPKKPIVLFVVCCHC
jgi:hypothetical protein